MAAIYDGVRDYRKDYYTKFGKPYRYDDEEISTPNYGTLIYSLPDTNGEQMVDDSDVVMHLVGNSAASTWPSTVGSISATKIGAVTTGVETAFYPTGGFAGSNYRSAVSGFNPTGFYSIPYNADIEFGPSQISNMIMIFRTGNFSKDETLMSKYVLASLSYNFRIMINTAGTLNFTVGMDGSDASTSATLLKPYTYYVVYFGWDPGSSRVYINANGVSYSNNTGSGNVITDNTTPYRIGSDAGAVGNYALTTHIIEIWKQNRGALTTVAEFNDMFRVLTGTMPTVGILPSFQYRGSVGTTLVNNKLWQFGDNLFRKNEKGLKIEDGSGNYVVNSTFRQVIGTGWGVVAAGSTTVAIGTGGQEFSTVGGRYCQISSDLTASEGKIYQDVGSVSSGEKIVFSVDYSVSNSAAKAYWQAYNATSTNWYNASSNTWQASPVSNLIGSSTSRTRAAFYFNNDAANGNVSIAVTNDEDADNASKSIYVYHVQFEVTTSLHERIITDAIAVTFAEEVFIFPSTWMDFTKGAMTFSLYPSTSNSNSISFDRDVIGSGSLFMGTPSGGTGFRLVDGSGNQLNVSGSYQIDDEIDFVVQWEASATMSIKSTKLGVNSSTAMGNAYSPGFIGLGQEGNVGVAILNGSLKTLRIYGP